MRRKKRRKEQLKNAGNKALQYISLDQFNSELSRFRNSLKPAKPFHSRAVLPKNSGENSTYFLPLSRCPITDIEPKLAFLARGQGQLSFMSGA
ncbi:hypothetical protein IQ273_23875 [Nodosilinea sp. LEGE 07298]|uniref:hypothetical protein n=1 Tax=Nodosilinea sp. LEGE 07298 TaxID=2777970 RepID=UPI00187DFC4A|nr:hypothetical protein [Nodosilinea sp. LEGE 07298]MBE9112437.1 hypothetical protein [Nodosilinea sp. LEGE 07298]